MTGLPPARPLLAFVFVLICSGCEAKGKSLDAPPRRLESAITTTPAAPTPSSVEVTCEPTMLQVSPPGQPPFCVDRYEANLIEADTSRAHPATLRPAPGVRYRAVSVGGVLPQAYVNRFEAAAACEAAGKRLCRAREWYRACSGPDHTKYPYGNKFVKGRCNVDKGHLLHKLFGNVTYTYDAHYNNPSLNQQAGFLARTGEYADCVSSVGARDMMGNLHEWVADDVSAQLREELPLEKGDQWLGKRGMGVFMGGYFSSHGEHGTGCLYVTATHAPDYHDYSTGFRCCADL
ncbi:MAG: SUMF1/EgtB/PvdO family nonheme iron enzyme [Myxococcales bacterium]|nr:SUMF1/EgtB/PvdO family nonheme iron enzyme [Myxococcales bacterium]